MWYSLRVRPCFFLDLDKSLIDLSKINSITYHNPDKSNFNYKNITKLVGSFLLNYYDSIWKII